MSWECGRYDVYRGDRKRERESCLGSRLVMMGCFDGGRFVIVGVCWALVGKSNKGICFFGYYAWSGVCEI